MSVMAKKIDCLAEAVAELEERVERLEDALEEYYPPIPMFRPLRTDSTASGNFRTYGG